MHNFYATAKFHIITYLCSSVSDVCRSPSLGPRSSTRRWHFRLRKAALLASAVAFVCATAHHDKRLYNKIHSSARARACVCLVLLANVNSFSCSLYVVVRPSVVCLSVVCNVGAPYSSD